jgi:demethoxyubiquinone hydroxylase (CLK1/Coq7/Cat5 family)
MQITTLELNRLNFYRASELHGGLVLGQLVRRARDPALILNLTRHSAEEVQHAQLWTETMLDVGGTPSPIRATYQTRLARAIGAPSSIFQVLALTQVFERRVYGHFIHHSRRPGTHPVVRRTLERMVEEERGHLSWVHDWLEAESDRRGIDLGRVLDDYAVIDARIYAELLCDYGFMQAA